MIFFGPNLNIRKLLAKARKPRNTILGFPKRWDVMQIQDKTLPKGNNKIIIIKLDFLAHDDLSFLFVNYVLILPTCLFKGLLML
jgi:hypothetical protein